MRNFQGSVALVTGASRGFGWAAARALAKAGAHVVALARTPGGLEELDDLIQAEGGQATLVPLDIADDDGLARMGAAIHGRWGRLDLWLHTAAFAPHLTPVDRADDKDFTRTFAINVTAFQRLIRVVDPLLRQAEAPLALVAADPRGGEKFFGPYGAAKAAQSALTRSWAAEAPRLTVAEVIPPPMPTALRARFFPGEDRAGLTQPAEAATRLMTALAGEIETGQALHL